MSPGVNRRAALALVLAASAAPALAATPPPLSLSGRFVQGGYAVGRTTPRAEVLVNGQVETRASASGWFVIGFDRDEGAAVTVKVRTPDGQTDRALTIAPGRFDVQNIKGLPQNQVSPSDPALLARIAGEVKRKNVGFASRDDGDGFRSGFAPPLAAMRMSARFGGQRILNGEPKRPHYGTDLAATVGTPVRAPADGIVAFAEIGLHFEGGLVLIDHGQGLISMYLHLSKVNVARGQRVRRGEVIAAVGKEGRATGPHLCWRLKWHGRNLDPMLLLEPDRLR